MSAQKCFLLRLFHLLDEHRVEYCITRNYENFYEAIESDIDFLAAEKSLPLFLELCRRAAAENSFLFVQQNHFVNHSFIFWNQESGFIRIDVEIENRWKIFHVLKASEVLQERRRFEEFFIPSPQHEAAILLTQTAWLNSLTGRYARRLQILQQEIPPRQFSEMLHHAFSLRSFSLNAPDLPQIIRAGLRRKTFRRPASFLKTIQYFFSDCLRFWQRLAKPCGLYFRSRTTNVETSDKILRDIEFLFPKGKLVFETGAPNFGQLLKAMFKGGLVVETLTVKSDEAARVSANRAATTFLPSRTFVDAEYHDGNTQLAHVFSGAMTATNAEKRGPQTTQFIVRCLAKQCEPKPFERGRFVVLLGLDGAGKTTVAREISRMALEDSRFRGVKYFHWIPSLSGKIEFPWRSSLETPRKKIFTPNLIRSTVSLARLLKNIFSAHLSYWFRLRPLLRQGFVVLVDRYFYNYWIDPQSVKYFAPQKWLTRWLRFFPQPELMIRLRADATTLRSRKRELSLEEIADQTKQLEQAPLYGTDCVDLDATESPTRLAEKAFAAIRNPGSSNLQASWKDLFQSDHAGETIVTRHIALQKSGRAFLFLPVEPELAVTALELYPAQTCKARAARKLVRLLLSAGIVLKTNTTTLPMAAPFSFFLRSLVGNDSAIPPFAVLAGNPRTPGSRFIFLVFNRGLPAGVVKAGTGAFAQKLIEREKIFLTSLPETFKNIPRTIAEFRSDTVSAFALKFVQGRSPQPTDDSGINRVLRGWLDETRVMPLSEIPTWQRLVAACNSNPDFIRLAARLGNKTFCPTIFHGDFTPWNIKVVEPSGDWVALDWERGELAGIPGWDWFHFRIQSAILVRKLSASDVAIEINRFIDSELFKKFAEAAKIESIKHDLLLAYLFFVTEVEKPSEGLETLKQLLTKLQNG